MSPRLPNLTPKQVRKALLRAGFEEKRIIGSHLHLWHPLTGHRTQVPIHNRDLKRGLLKAILRQADLSEEKFRGFI